MIGMSNWPNHGAGDLNKMLDCSQLTWEQMSEIIFSIRAEALRRNPIGINLYTPYLKEAEEALLEIAEGEAVNPTSAFGPTKSHD